VTVQRLDGGGVVCQDCGLVDEAPAFDVAPAGTIADVMVRLSNKQDHVEHVQAELALLRGRLSKLKNDETERAKQSALSPWARQCYDHWKAVIRPRSREFDKESARNVIARLRAFDDPRDGVEEIMWAINGAKLAPPDRHGKRWDDLAHICKSEAFLHRYQEHAERPALPTGPQSTPKPSSAPDPTSTPPKSRGASEDTMRGYVGSLSPTVIYRLGELRHWDPDVVRELGLGLDAGRVVFPVRNAHGVLDGLVRYQPNPEKRGNAPKSLAEGSRDLFPAPESYEAGAGILLCEGEGDSVAARTMGFRVVSVPGVGTWKAGWVHRLECFDRVTVCFDCDEQGRTAALARARTLEATIGEVQVIDLDPERTDGFDIGDLLMERGPAWAREHILGLATKATETLPEGLKADPPKRKPAQMGIPLEAPSSADPVDTVLSRLRERGHKVTGMREGSGKAQWEAQCPAHDDRHSSLSVGRGADDRALLTCHAGCEPRTIVDALGLEFGELFRQDRQA